jgi:hypothetical protein
VISLTTPTATVRPRSAKQRRPRLPLEENKSRHSGCKGKVNVGLQKCACALLGCAPHVHVRSVLVWVSAPPCRPCSSVRMGGRFRSAGPYACQSVEERKRLESVRL